MATIARRTDTNGATRYQVKVRLKGHPPQTATFTRLTDARKWATQTEAAIRERRHFRTVEAQKHTLAELVDRYIRDVLPTKGRQQHIQEAQLAYWSSELGAYTLADVTLSMITEVRDKLLRSPSPRGGFWRSRRQLLFVSEPFHSGQCGDLASDQNDRYPPDCPPR